MFKVKRNSDKIIRHKPRLLPRYGTWVFSQKYGIDYDKNYVFASVVRQATFRNFLAVVGQNQMSIEHFDAKTAFLNGKRTEAIYMWQPEGNTVPGKNNYVCKLNKGIYDLKQAAKLWSD